MTDRTQQALGQQGVGLPTLTASGVGSIAENIAALTATGVRFTVGNHASVMAADFTVYESDGSVSQRFGVVSDGSGGWGLSLLANQPLDFETEVDDDTGTAGRQINLEVEVSNGGETSVRQAVTVAVTDTTDISFAGGNNNDGDNNPATYTVNETPSSLRVSLANLLLTNPHQLSDFTLSDDRFEITSQSNRVFSVSVRQGQAFDHESEPVVALTVSVGGASQDFTITVDDRNETPTVSNRIDAITFTKDTGIQSFDVSTIFTDPDDGDSLTYSFLGVLPEVATLMGSMLMVDTDAVAISSTAIGITATDTGARSANIVFDVVVAPSLSASGTGMIDERIAVETATDITLATSYTSAQADDFTVYESDGSESTRFDVVSDGGSGWSLILLADRAVDFETEADDDPDTAGTQIALEVTVTQNNAESLRQAVAITVGDIDETVTLTVASQGARAFAIVNGVEFRQIAPDSVILDTIRFIFNDSTDVVETNTANGVDGYRFIFSTSQSPALNALELSQDRVIAGWASDDTVNSLIATSIRHPFDIPFNTVYWGIRGFNENSPDYAFTAGTASPDLTVAKGDFANATARGHISVSGALNTVFYGDTSSIEVDSGGNAIASTRTFTHIGTYGTLTIDHDGDWVYTLNPASTALAMLNTGQMATESFTITITDIGQDGVLGGDDDTTATQDIAITVEGGARTLAVNNEGGRAFTIINGIEFRHINPDVTLFDAVQIRVDSSPTIVDVVNNAGVIAYRFGFATEVGRRQPQDLIDLDFMQQRVVTAWGRTDAVDHIKVTIREVLATTSTDWIPIVGQNYLFTPGTDAPDLSVAEGTLDITAQGYLNTIGARGQVFYGASGDSSVTITGTGTARLASYQGTYGNLVIDHDGDWFYTLDRTLESLATFNTGDTATENFTITITDLGSDGALGGGDDTTITQAIAVTVEGNDETLIITLNDDADLEVNEAGANTTANGALTVTNPTNADSIVFGTDMGEGITVTGTGTGRQVTYTGIYGNLVLNHNGTWGYTVDRTRESFLSLFFQQIEQDDFTITVTDTGADGILGTADDVIGTEVISIGVSGQNNPVRIINTDTGMLATTGTIQESLRVKTATGISFTSNFPGNRPETFIIREVGADNSVEVSTRFGVVDSGMTDSSGRTIFNLVLLAGNPIDFETERDADPDTDDVQIPLQVLLDSNFNRFTLTVTNVWDPELENVQDDDLDTDVAFVGPGNADNDLMASGQFVETSAISSYRLVNDGQHGRFTLDTTTLEWDYRLDLANLPSATGFDTIEIEITGPGDGEVFVHHYQIPIHLTPNLRQMGMGSVDERVAVETDTGLTLLVDRFSTAEIADFTVVEVVNGMAQATASTRFAVRQINGDFKIVLLAGNPLNFNDETSIRLQVTVTNTDMATNTTLTSTPLTVVIGVGDLPEPPTRNDTTAPEPSFAEGVVGDFTIANLFDAGSEGAPSYTYTATRMGQAVDTTAWLALDSASGEFTIAEGATDDSEIGTYTLTITASDGDDRSVDATAEVMLTITNTNDAPVVDEAPPTVIIHGIEFTLLDLDTTMAGVQLTGAENWAVDYGFASTASRFAVNTDDRHFDLSFQSSGRAAANLPTFNQEFVVSQVNSNFANQLRAEIVEVMEIGFVRGQETELNFSTNASSTTNEDTVLGFVAADFRFSDEDSGDALASITIVTLPDIATGRLMLGDMAVTAGQVVLVGEIPMLSFTPAGNRDEPFSASFTYTVSDGTASSSPASTYTITVNADNDAPVFTGASTAFLGAGGVRLLNGLLNASDAESGAGALTYRITATTNGVIEQNMAGMGQPPNWVAIGRNDRFTQEQVDNGLVRFVGDGMGAGTLDLRLNDGNDVGGTVTVPTISFNLRAAAEVDNPTTLGGGGFDLSMQASQLAAARAIAGATAGDSDGQGGTITQTQIDDAMSEVTRLTDELATPLTVATGVGDNTITTGTGDDSIDAGAGDDVVDLSLGGADEVIYRFEPVGSGNARAFVAMDGGDRVMGFAIGDDALVFANTSDSQAGADLTVDFLNGLGTAFDAKFSYALRGASLDSSLLASYNVTGVEIHFPQAVLLPGGRLSGSILEIEFETPMMWADFNSEYLINDANDMPYAENAFNMRDLELMGNTAGRDALARILGIDVMADSSRGVIIGTDGADTGANALTAMGEVVILGQGGDDSITLDTGANAAAQEIVYTLEDNGTTVTSTDGRDTITNFTLGSDSLRFVDTDGEAPTLTDLLARPSVSVALTTNASNDYTGVTFTIESGDSVAINFATAIGEDDLDTRLGLTDGTPIPATVTAEQLEMLFGETDGEDNISITDSLPTELL